MVFLLNLLYNPSKVISFLVAMKTTSGSIKRATSGKKNFGEIIILASPFHVIRQWRMVQNRPVSRVCFVPNSHQSKKAVFCCTLISTLQPVHYLKTNNWPVYRPPSPQEKYIFPEGGGLYTGYKKGWLNIF